MFTLSDIHCGYKVFAIVIILYQAYRGFMFQWIFGAKSIKEVKRRVLLLCLADMFTYFVCAFSGFACLFMLYYLNSQASDSARTQGDHLLQIFLLIYGILGVTGKLPDLLNRIGTKFPGNVGD